MSYKANVSALGAIVAALIGLFGFRTSTALMIAPLIGAPLGLIFAIVSLRRYGLPLNSKLEAYRSAAGIVAEAPKAYLNAALGVALIVVLVELPSIMLGQDTVLVVCAAGCIVVFGGTIYRSWHLTNTPVRLDIFQIAGGTGCLAIFGSIVYVFTTEIELNQTISKIDLVKLIFVINGIAAILSAVPVCFALAIASSLVAGTGNPGR